MSKGPWRPLEVRLAEKRDKVIRAERLALKRAEKEVRRIKREARRINREKAEVERVEMSAGHEESTFHPRLGCMYCCGGGSEDTIPINGLSGPTVGFVCLDCKAMFI